MPIESMDIPCKSINFEFTVKNIDHPDYHGFRNWASVFVGILILLSVSTMGLLWYYEKYGGDPRKRSIFNQLIGMMGMTVATWMMASVGTLLCRLIFGPLSMTQFIVAFSTPLFVSSLVIQLILNEIIILRFLTIVIWKQLPPINDDFFALFFFCLNYGLAFLFLSLGLLGGPPITNVTFLMTGAYFPWEPKLSGSK